MRKIFLFVILYATICIIKLKEARQKTDYKNVLLIVADDLGITLIKKLASFFSADLKVEKLNKISSENIDRLARGGIILDQAYTYSMCTPSRSSMLSGVFAERVGLQHYVIMPQHPVGLPTSYTLMPQIFKQFGYKTHMVGKWHLGFCNKKYTPVERGFDSFYGYFNGQEDYMTHRVKSQLDRGKVEGLDFWNQTDEYLVPVLDKNDTYSMFTFTDEAIRILESHDRQKNFFMYFSSQNCHLPNQIPKKYEDKYPFEKNEERRKYLGMISMLDESIGNITQKLSELDMLDNTLIVFTSDNGGAVYSAGRNFPLRGGKFTPYEGGHRIKAFINGPGIKKPYVNKEMFHTVDWLPTILNGAIGHPIELDGIDGVNQWPSLTNNLPGKRNSFIYNIDQFGQYGCGGKEKTEAIREGNWKLIKGCTGLFNDWYIEPKFTSDFVDIETNKSISLNNVYNPEKTLAKFTDVLYLFNLNDDPLEIKNLAEMRPDVVERLEAKLNEYKERVVVKPLNPPWMKPSDESNPANFGDKWAPGWCEMDRNEL